MSEWIETRLPNCRLRFAEPEDIPLILTLIQELAVYEKMLDDVVATEEGLYSALFGERAFVETVLAYHQLQPAGFMLFFHNYSTFLSQPGLHLEDLYVRPAFRGKGIGHILLAWLAMLATQRGCKRLEWLVLDWNAPAIAFYDRMGARSVDGWTVKRVSESALQVLAEQF